jgi:hypothetical protein
MASRRTGSIPASGWPANYEIRVSGTLAPEWSAWFEELRVTSTEEETLIVGRLPISRPARSLGQGQGPGASTHRGSPARRR